MAGDGLAVAGLFQAAGVLAEEFAVSVEAFGEAVLHRGSFTGAFGGGEAVEVTSFFPVHGIAADPGQDVALFGEDRVDDLAAQTEASFVAAPSVGRTPTRHFFIDISR